MRYTDIQSGIVDHSSSIDSINWQLEKNEVHNQPTRTVSSDQGFQIEETSRQNNVEYYNLTVLSLLPN